MSPRDCGKDEGKLLVVGIVPLVYITNRFKRKNFVVSALGTRYGLVLGVARLFSIPTLGVYKILPRFAAARRCSERRLPNE